MTKPVIIRLLRPKSRYAAWDLFSVTRIDGKDAPETPELQQQRLDNYFEDVKLYIQEEKQFKTSLSSTKSRRSKRLRQMRKEVGREISEQQFILKNRVHPKQ